MKALNPVVWLVWSLAAMFIVVTTRNPLYLALTGGALVAVYLAMHRSSIAGAAWRTFLRIGIVIAALNIAFNLLTVHVGDRVLAWLPSGLPIFGGAITFNALIYGLITALALLDLLLIAAIFSTAVNRAALLRLLPGQFAALGVAGIVALSFLQKTLLALPFGFTAVLVLWQLMAPQAGRRGRYRPVSWERVDWLQIAAAALAITLYGASLILLPDVLAYYPYPRLTAPPFSLWPGIACLLLVMPALAGARRDAS